MDAIEFMARFEEDGLRFFETLGAESIDAERKGLFELLADNQKRHLGSLEKLKENLHGIETDTTLVDRAGVVVNGFRRTLGSYDLPKEFRQDADAFDHIVKAEEEVIELLDGMAKAEAEENTRELLVLLAEEEKRHLSRMENIYEFIEAPRSFLEWGEFSNLHQL
ncbi:MAG: ferritin family protein [Oryzomonas sp.]|uniref:ferritin family protein n=1 Tax=Oryzomonas sp. TaxID=2855186 RepID=UPI00283EEB19|nr:ferritin family protein [Oryzomonas sp.]MDR3579908.1 ferritin family protein [Oryzomonas sp.]